MTASTRIIFNTLATYGRSVFALVLGLFSSRWVLGALGKEDFGLFGVVGSIIFFVGLLNGIMSAAVSRYYAYSIGGALNDKTEDGRDEIVRWFNAALSVHAILPTLLVAIGYPVGCYAIRHWLVIPPERITACIWVFRLALVAAFVNMISVPYLAMYRAKQLIAELSFWGMLTTIVTFVCAYLLLSWDGDRLVAYAAYMTFLPAVITLIQVYRAHSQFGVCKLRLAYLFQWDYIKRLFVFASGEFFGWLGGSIRDNGMPFLINVNFGAGMNAAYTIGNQVSGQTVSLSSAMIGALMPAVTTAEGAGDHEKAMRLSFCSIKFGVLLILVFCIPLILEIDEVLRIWLVNPPEQTAVICRCVLLALVCHKLGWGHHLAILAKGKIVAYQMVLGITGAIGLLIAWVLVHLGLGMLGIGLSFVIIFVIMTIERVVFARFICGMSVKYWLMHIVMPLCLTLSASMSVASISTFVFSPTIFRICLTSLVSFLVLVVTSWFVVCDCTERSFIYLRFVGIKEKCFMAKRNG